MANVAYNVFKFLFSEGQISLLTDTIKVLLVNNYIIDVSNHNYVSDISAYEVAGGGYISGGNTLLNKGISRNDTNNRSQFSATSVQWVNLTVSANGAIIYKDTGNITNSPLICYIDFLGNKFSNNTNFTIEWSQQEGILYLT